MKGNTNTEDTLQKELDILTIWYDSYFKIIKFIGTISVSIILFTTSFLLKDLLEGQHSAEISSMGVLAIKQSFSLFLISLFCVFTCLIFTYNWYRSGISKAMKTVKSSNFPDDFWYDDAWLSMKVSGALSWVFGGIAGVSLFFGIIIFVVKIFKLLDLMIATL